MSHVDFAQGNPFKKKARKRESNERKNIFRYVSFNELFSYRKSYLIRERFWIEAKSFLILVLLPLSAGSRNKCF